MTIRRKDLRITSFDSFEAAAPAWTSFEEHADLHGVGRFAWLEHWHATVGCAHIERLSIVQVELAGTPLMLLPLGVLRVGPTACLTWLGGDITDYHAPLLSKDFSRRVDADGFAVIWTSILEALPRHDALRLHKQPEMIGAQPNPFLTLPGTAAHDINRWCALEESWDAFHAEQVPARLRGDSRRKRRRLSEQGQLEFVVARSPDAMRTINESMIAQKVARYESTGTYSLFNDAAYRTFFLQPSEALLASGMLHVSAIRLDDQHIAAHWGIVHRRRFYFIMASFAAGEWERFSPGRLLVEDLLEWCFANGVQEFDFTIGDEPFKKTWANRESGLFRTLEARNLLGATFVARERFADWIRARPGLHQSVSRLRNKLGR